MSNEYPASKRTITKDNWLKRGEELMKLERYAEASICYGDSLIEFPSDAQLLYCKAVAHHHAKDFLSAIDYYCQALQKKIDFAEAFENLSEAQEEMLMFNEALISIHAAIALKPNKYESYIRLGRILVRLRKYDEAIKVANNALKIEPNNPQAYMIRSNAYSGLIRLKESIYDLRLALAIKPGDTDYIYNLAFNLLLNQEFEEGWACYESRFQTKNYLNHVPNMVAPRWYGDEKIDGKRILISPEQGIGDQIQFARYALILKEMGASVILAVMPQLVDILQSMHQDIIVTSALQPANKLPAHDYYVPIMSLPGIFQANIKNIPFNERYISPNESIAAKWRERFANTSKMQVGVTWSGSRSHQNDINRSMSLAQLAPLLNLDVDLHVLQTEIRPDDEELLKQCEIKDWRKELINMHETAGLLDQLDLLITVDTSVAHLSAALGKATWIMLPFEPDFRWLLDRSDSPWYASVQLFRQTQPGNWASVIDAISQKVVGRLEHE